MNESRREHYKVVRQYRAESRAQAKEYGLPRFCWQSWVRHFAANTSHTFWGIVPHRPRWVPEEMTVGAVDHVGREDAVAVWDYESCSRCHADNGDWVRSK